LIHNELISKCTGTRKIESASERRREREQEREREREREREGERGGSATTSSVLIKEERRNVHYN